MNSAYRVIKVIGIVILVSVLVYQQVLIAMMRSEVLEVTAMTTDEVARLRADVSKLAQMKSRFWELANTEEELADNYRAEQLAQTLMVMHASMSLSYLVQGNYRESQKHADSATEYERHLEGLRAEHDELTASKVAILNRP